MSDPAHFCIGCGRLRKKIATEREVRAKAEKERDDARSNTVAGLSHRVLTSYGAPNHPGLTLLGRIEALADSRDRVIVARKQAEKERDALRDALKAQWKREPRKATHQHVGPFGQEDMYSKCTACGADNMIPEHTTQFQLIEHKKECPWRICQDALAATVDRKEVGE